MPRDIAWCQGHHVPKLKIITELTLLVPEAKVTRVPCDIAKCQGRNFPKVTRIPWEEEGFLVPAGARYAYCANCAYYAYMKLVSWGVVDSNYI